MFNSTQEDANMVSKTIWRLPNVMSRTGLSRSSIYNKISKGEFPEQVRLGIRSVGWISGEVDDWIENRIDASRNGN